MQHKRRRAARTKAQPEASIHPPEQIGKRLTPVQLAQAHASDDALALSREGGYAIDKIVWLQSPEQQARPDLADRERSPRETLVLTHTYVRRDLAHGRERLRAGERGRQTKAAARKVRDRAALAWVAAQKWPTGKQEVKDGYIIRCQGKGVSLPDGAVLLLTLRTLSRMRARNADHWRQLKARFKP